MTDRITVSDRWLCYLEVVIKNRRNAWLLLFIVTGVLSLAGCGGGDSSDETAAPATTTTTTDEPASVTKDELISQGDDLCSSVNAAVGTIDASTSADESVKDSQKGQIYSGLADDLTALGTPTDGPAPTDVIAAATALGDAESTGSDTTTAASDLATAAGEYGFTECAAAPAAPAGTSTGGSVDSGSSTDTTTPPATTTPVPTTPAPTTPVPATPPPASTGGGASPDTGGASPGAGSGGISPG